MKSMQKDLINRYGSLDADVSRSLILTHFKAVGGPG